METNEKNNFEEKIENNISQKPKWFVCFFKVIANSYLGGFIGKDLRTGEKLPNRFLAFIVNVFVLTIKSLPIALFVSYFLITLPTWVFVLAIVIMALRLFFIVYTTNETYNATYNETYKGKQPKEEPKDDKEQANNHAKYYEYGGVFYKNKPTTLIVDFFRFIGTQYFAFLLGKDFMFCCWLNQIF